MRNENKFYIIGFIIFGISTIISYVNAGMI